MQRRTFLQTASVVVAPSWATYAIAQKNAGAAGAKSRFEDGVDYLSVKMSMAPEAAPGVIEVVEFFRYGCPHCNRFEPELDAWSKKQPKDVMLRRVSVAPQPDWEAHQRMFYVLQELKQLERLHKKVFEAIHVKNFGLANKGELRTWAIDHGVRAEDFDRAWSSFGVQGNVNRANNLVKAYGLSRVPAIGVASKYYTDGALARTVANTLKVTEHLIELERKKLKSTKA